MKNLSLIALIAAGIFALYTAPTFAATTMTGGPGPCKVNCNPPPGGDQPGDDPTEPGEPFDPKFPNGDPGEPGDDPTDPGDDPEDGKDPDPDCMIDCGPGDGDPGDDPKDDPKDDPNDNGQPGDGADLSKAELAQLNACLIRLDGLPVVSETEIKGFSDPSKVSLVPVCEVKSLTEVETAIVEKGNAQGLEDDIKANTLMRTKLGMTAYKARDVIGIDFDEKGNAILFVHKLQG